MGDESGFGVDKETSNALSKVDCIVICVLAVIGAVLLIWSGYA